MSLATILDRMPREDAARQLKFMELERLRFVCHEALMAWVDEVAANPSEGNIETLREVRKIYKRRVADIERFQGGE